MNVCLVHIASENVDTFYGARVLWNILMPKHNLYLHYERTMARRPVLWEEYSVNQLQFQELNKEGAVREINDAIFWGKENKQLPGIRFFQSVVLVGLPMKLK